MRIITIILLCTLLLSCGFSLRQPVQLAEHIQAIAISPDDPYRPLQRTVRETLAYSGVELDDESPIILKLQPEEVLRSTYVVDTSGDVAQELLTYTLRFELVDKDHNILIPMQTIKTDRILYIHENQLLSVNREERTLIDDMRQEAVLQLIRRLAAYDEN
jgi:LPS-assembly lipoprotein